MSDCSHNSIDEGFKKRSHVIQLIRRCAMTELRYEHVCKWMREHEPQTLDTILEETKELGYDMQLEFEKKVDLIIQDIGGTL